MEYFESLKQLGFNEREQGVYLVLLEIQKAKINELAQRANTKRSTTYDILYRLKKEGFVSELLEGKKHYFVANDPEMILGLLEEKKRLYKRELPAILTLYNTLPQKPKVAYFEGLEGIKQLYEDALLTLTKGDEILAYVGDYELPELEEYMHEYVKRRAKKGIKARGIAENKPGIKEFTKENKSELRVTKLVNESKFDLENEINIYANKVIIITYEPEPFGVLIESKTVANTQRAIFEMAWRGLKD